MKKRFIYFLFMLVLPFALSACSGGQDDSTEILEIDAVTVQLDNSIPSDNDITESEDVIGSSTATEPEDAIGSSTATKPDHDNEDGVEPQNNDKENSTTKSDTDKNVNDTIPLGDKANNSSTKSNNDSQSSVTIGILNSSATPQNGNGNLGADDEGNKNSDTQMSESENKPILAE